MDINLLTIGALTAYFAVIILMGVLSGRHESRDAFMIAERKVHPFWSSLSIVATWFDGPFLFTFVTLGFVSFYSTIWICVGVALGLMFYILGAPKVRELTERYNCYSYPELSYELFDKKTGLLVSALSFIVFLGLVVLVLVAGAQLLEALGNIPYATSVILMGLVSAIYLILGGFKASILTDIFQMIVLGGLCLMLALFAQTPEQMSFPPLSDFPATFQENLGSMLIFIFAVMFSSDGLSRVIASKSPKAARQASVMTIILFSLLGLFLAIWGIAAAGLNPTLDPSQAPIYLFTEMIPQWLYPFTLVALFAVLMSSVDTYAIVAAQALMNDGLIRLGVIDQKEKHPRQILRVGLIVVFALAILASFTISDIVEGFFVLIMFIGCGCPMIMAIITGKKNTNAVFTAMCLSLIAHLGLFVSGHLTEIVSGATNALAVLLWAGMTYSCKKTEKLV